MLPSESFPGFNSLTARSISAKQDGGEDTAEQLLVLGGWIGGEV